MLLLLCAIAIVLSRLTISGPLPATVRHALEIVAIVALAWLAVGAIEIFNALVNYRLPDNTQDDVRARRKRTQAQLLRQIITGFILFSAAAAVMMTFPSVRNIGAELFASAGLALGMAARPALGNRGGLGRVACRWIGFARSTTAFWEPRRYGMGRSRPCK